MDKIKEKPQATSSIREKITAAPKELVHRGLEDGTNHLRTQLRDAAQQGRRDDYGGDQIEDTAAGGMRRMERGAEKLIKEKRKNRASRDGSSADSTAVDPVPEIRTREHESRVNAAAADQPAEPVGKAGQRIKTKDAYLLKRKRRFPACHQSAPRASSPSSGSADGRRRRDPRRTELSGCGSRQAAGRSLLSLWEIAGSPAELRLGMGAGRTGPYRPRGQRRSLPRMSVRCQKGKTECLP